MKQEILDKIKTIKSAKGLSRYYSSLSVELRADDDIIKAFKDRRKEL